VFNTGNRSFFLLFFGGRVLVEWLHQGTIEAFSSEVFVAFGQIETNILTHQIVENKAETNALVYQWFQQLWVFQWVTRIFNVINQWEKSHISNLLHADVGIIATQDFVEFCAFPLR